MGMEQKENNVQNDMLFYLNAENHDAAYEFLDPRNASSKAISILTDKGTISMCSGAEKTIYLNGKLIGELCFTIYPGIGHMHTVNIFLPIKLSENVCDDVNKEVIWTLKRK